MRKIYLFLAANLCLLQYDSFSQSPGFELGLKISKEFTDGKNDGAGFGVQSVYTLAKNFSIETGISYKINPVKQLVYQTLGANTRPFFDPFSETEKTILIPLSLRLNAGPLIISAGTGLHFLLNKTDFANVDIPEKADWKTNNMEIVTSLAISKSFRVNRTMYIEPEVKYCRYSQDGGNGFQLNLSMRRHFL